MPTDDVTSAQHDAADEASAPDEPEVAAADVPQASDSAMSGEDAKGEHFGHFNLLFPLVDTQPAAFNRSQ